MAADSVRPTERSVSRRRFIKRAVAAGGIASACGSPVSGSALAQQPGGVRSFDHVALPMQNTEAMLAFYRALGFVVAENASTCRVHFGDQKINFHRPATWQREAFTLRGPTAKPGCGDLCFVWDGRPESLRAVLDRAGAKIIEGPATRDGGRDGGKATGTSVYVRDPDSNLLEFIIYS
jgi:catechol 2,3-dioxygenase-like lactoylglutathione lyase family enzyme